jgi:hypothetical protein
MKQFLGLLAAVCLMIGGAATQSNAAPVGTTHTPFGDLTNGDTFGVGGLFNSPTGAGLFDEYQFSLSAPATNSNLIIQYAYTGLAAQFILSDNLGNLYSATPISLGGGGFQVTFANLAAGLTYFLDFAGHVNAGFSFYGGSAQLAATPIPAALLLFVSALGGLGFAGYRRRKLSA